MKTQLIHNDSEYRTAVNCPHHNFYNFPCSLLIDGKKFYIGCGTQDRKDIKIKNGLVYFLASNGGLDYISLTVINPITEEVNEVFLGNGELSYNPLSLPKGKQIFDYSINYQIRKLSQFI
jgi:hypothetical protein